MWFVLTVAVVGFAVWYWLHWKQSSKVADAGTSQSPDVYVPLSLRVDAVTTNRSEVRVRYEAVNGGWRIGTNLPYPLTLSGIDAADAKRLAAAAEQWNYDEFKDWLVHVIAKSNVRCVEVDQWMRTARPTFEAAVQRSIAASPEWNGASERDREDLLLGFRTRAAEDLSLRPRAEIALALLTNEPKDLGIDDALLAKFTDRPDLYPVLLSALAHGDDVQILAVGDYQRKEFDALAERGYVRRGDAIPMDAILKRLTLKQMAQVAGDSAPKKFGRKAAAIEFLKTLPNLKERVGKVIAFRELFQPVPVTGTETSDLLESYRHAGELSRVIRQTLFAGVRSLQELSYEADGSEVGWILDGSECCPDCMKRNGQTWKRRPTQFPPFHIGCKCAINQKF